MYIICILLLYSSHKPCKCLNGISVIVPEAILKDSCWYFTGSARFRGCGCQWRTAYHYGTTEKSKFLRRLEKILSMNESHGW